MIFLGVRDQRPNWRCLALAMVAPFGGRLITFAAPSTWSCQRHLVRCSPEAPEPHHVEPLPRPPRVDYWRFTCFTPRPLRGCIGVIRRSDEPPLPPPSDLPPSPQPVFISRLARPRCHSPPSEQYLLVGAMVASRNAASRKDWCVCSASARKSMAEEQVRTCEPLRASGFFQDRRLILFATPPHEEKRRHLS